MSRVFSLYGLSRENVDDVSGRKPNCDICDILFIL